MAERGFVPLTVAEALAAAEGLLHDGLLHDGSLRDGRPRPATDVAGIGRYRWDRARRLLPALGTARFSGLVPADAAPDSEGRADLLRELAALAPDDARAAITHTTRPVTDFGLAPPLSTEFLVRAGEHYDVSRPPN